MKSLENNLTLLQKQAQKKTGNNRQFIPKPYKDVAQGMEKQFVQYMIEQMNQSVGQSENGNSTAKNFYKSLMTSEQAKTMTETGSGTGIQDMVLDQIYPQNIRNSANYHAFLEQEKRKQQPQGQKIEMGPTQSKKTLVQKFEKGSHHE